MCGIAGFIDLAGRRPERENDSIARAMGDALAHRGPDGNGIWSDDSARLWFSHRRLAVVELSEAGAQPMSTPDGKGLIAYNGEIYNSADLIPDLRSAGYVFRGHSDTEALLYGCQHWGVEKTLAKAVGMFAFAYWDKASRTLTLARDRLGKKPLYWAKTGSSFIFASELKALRTHPDAPDEIDRDSVAGYLRYAYVPQTDSIYAGVGKVGPGEMLEFNLPTGRVRRSTYWSLLEAAERGSSNPFRGTAEDAVDETESLVAMATRDRLVSDVPLGAFLSGGIDSSTIVAMMQRYGSEPARTFAIGYDDPEYDEADHARAIAAHLGTRHEELILEPRDAMAVIPDLPAIFDEPFADVSQIPTYLVSRLARQHVTVALSGDGGDEVFAGYNRHVAAGGLLRRLNRVPAPLRAAMARSLKALPPDRWQALFNPLPARLRPRSIGEKLHKLAPLLELDEADQYRRVCSAWPNPDELVIGGSERPDPAVDTALRRRFPDTVSWMRYLDLMTYLPGDILTKVDRASMAASLEARAPLLDHRLVEFSFRIPSSLHLRQGEGKWLLRRVLERHVPKSLFERPKMGFGIPVGGWLRGPLRSWAEDLLSERRLREAGLVHPEPIRRIWANHLSGGTNAQYLLWPVLMLHSWLDAQREISAPTPRVVSAAG
jgi:asparagine synthase (glutamine-hydrolysing)